MAEKRKIYIYEALELRAEYDARIKTFKDTLPIVSTILITLGWPSGS